MATTEQLREEVRDWVGSQPDDDTIDAALARFADRDLQPERTALVILRRRFADLEGDVSSMAVVDDVSWSRTDAGTKSLAQRIARLETITGDIAPSLLPTVTSAAICGPGNQR